MSNKTFFSVPVRIVSASAVRQSEDFSVSIKEVFALGADCIMAEISVSAEGSVQYAGADGVYSLDGLLSSFPGGRFILSAADLPCAEKLCTLLRRMDAQTRVLVTSADSAAVRYVRRTLPSCATVLTQGEALRALLLAKTGLLFLKKKFAGDALILSEHAGALKLLSAPFIREMTSKGVHVFAWGVDSPAAAKRLIDAGAGVITSKVKEVSSVL